MFKTGDNSILVEPFAGWFSVGWFGGRFGGTVVNFQIGEFAIKSPSDTVVLHK
ncbi:hypothetical protein ES703_72890 [subsurface metagenome]